MGSQESINPESVLLTYLRGGGAPPSDNEYIYIQTDGVFAMWRSVAWATYPPTAIGLFGGKLAPDGIAALAQEVTAANAVGRLRQRSSPDAPAETIETREARADVGIHDKPDNAWGPLIARLRQLLLDLTRYPQAALALTLSADGQRVQLVHQGDQPLRLDLSAVTLKAALWKPAESITVAEWTGQPQNLGGMVNAGPGWTLDVPFNPNFSKIAGSAVKVSATLTAFDGDSARPAALSTP